LFNIIISIEDIIIYPQLKYQGKIVDGVSKNHILQHRPLYLDKKEA